MKVFVWKAHGDISVWAITDSLKEDILTCLSLEGFEIVHGKQYDWREIQEMIYDAQESGSDMFECGSGVVKVREK